MPTQERIEEAMRNVGRLINMNNDQCAKAEEMLCQIMGVLGDTSNVIPGSGPPNPSQTPE